MAATVVKSNKKRSAPSQSGPAAKKAHLESSQKKKRSQPVTRAPSGSDTGSDSDELAEDVPNDDQDEMDVDEEVQKPPKDPQGALSICALFLCILRQIQLRARPTKLKKYCKISAELQSHILRSSSTQSESGLLLDRKTSPRQSVKSTSKT